MAYAINENTNTITEIAEDIYEIIESNGAVMIEVKDALYTQAELQQVFGNNAKTDLSIDTVIEFGQFELLRDATLYATGAALQIISVNGNEIQVKA